MSDHEGHNLVTDISLRWFFSECLQGIVVRSSSPDPQFLNVLQLLMPLTWFDHWQVFPKFKVLLLIVLYSDLIVMWFESFYFWELVYVVLGRLIEYLHILQYTTKHSLQSRGIHGMLISQMGVLLRPLFELLFTTKHRTLKGHLPRMHSHVVLEST